MTGRSARRRAARGVRAASTDAGGRTARLSRSRRRSSSCHASAFSRSSRDREIGAEPPAADRKVAALAEIGLDKDAEYDGPASCAIRREAAPGAALEREADHAGAASDAAFVDRSGDRGIDRRSHIARCHVASVNVVEEPVVGLRSDRQAQASSRAPGRTRLIQSMVASHAIPHALVLVIVTGRAKTPASSIMWVPVISPLPFALWNPAKTGVRIPAPAAAGWR